MATQSIITKPSQIGLVVRDLQRAIWHWSTARSVGPFFVFKLKMEGVSYRDVTITPEVEIGISWWGDIQIELIQQLNASPSPYRTFLDNGFEGLHHIGSIVEDMDASIEALAARGELVICQGNSGGFRFAYLALDEHAGNMIELMQDCAALQEFSAFSKAASLEWDGSDPTRYLG